MSDPELAEALTRLAQRRDDPDAWLSLYRFVRPMVLHLTARLTRGQLDLAEDVVQEVLVRLAFYCRFERLTDPAAFRAYVFAISRNVCRDQIRAGERRTLNALSQEAVERSSREGEEQTEADDLRRRLRNQLKPDDRQLLELVLEGRSVLEIAKTVQVDIGTARVRIHRLRNKLRVHVDKLWIESP
jgi:RNA polymerase sigma factor (sigma-70 family)